jgi:hypothetical protein
MHRSFVNISLVVAFVLAILRSGLGVIILVIIIIFVIVLIFFLVTNLQTIVVLEFLKRLNCRGEAGRFESLLDGLFTIKS